MTGLTNRILFQSKHREVPLKCAYFELRGLKLKSKLFGQLNAGIIDSSLKIQIILDRRDFEKLISPLRVSGNSWIEIFVSNAYTYACKLNCLIIFT